MEKWDTSLERTCPQIQIQGSSRIKRVKLEPLQWEFAIKQLRHQRIIGCIAFITGCLQLRRVCSSNGIHIIRSIHLLVRILMSSWMVVPGPSHWRVQSRDFNPRVHALLGLDQRYAEILQVVQKFQQFWNIWTCDELRQALRDILHEIVVIHV